MRLRLAMLSGAVALSSVLSMGAMAENKPHPSVIHSHSHEEDLEDERLSNAHARRRAAERIGWKDERRQRDPVIDLKVLGINDFHGQLAAGRMVGPRPVGGAAVLASYLKTAAAAAKDGYLLIHAGDHVGASPPDSALLQDEPSISFLNQLANRHCDYVDVAKGPWNLSYLQPSCNVIGTLGNHEFDEGVTELLRLIDGGNHAQGPFLDKKWRGARFPYISANVVSKKTREPVLSPFTVRWIDGVPVAVIGAVLKETPTIVTPSGVAGIEFLDEATEINRYAGILSRLGVKTIIVTIHQGIRQTPSYEGPTDPEVQGLSGPIVDIVRQLSSEVDVVVSGHAHGFTNALIHNAKGHPILVTQAFSASTAYGDIDISISRKSRDVIAKSAAVITTWADQGPGLTPDAAAASLAAAAAKAVEPRVNRIVGVATGDITVAENSAGESAMGNLIADAQRVQSGAQFAFMNPGGIRAGVLGGEVTWGELFTVQPFGNDLVTMDLTGAQVRTLLEQQWQGQSPTAPRILKTSGLTYTWDAARPVGQRVVEIRDASNQALVDSTVYRVTVNSFMASGGDNFLVLTQGTNRVVGATDLDALVAYIESLPQPFTVAVGGRIVRLN
jgi:5'-nucleotidase